jgi:phosphoribosylformimino-5-aminoimidazole carboxamide ribonucleotide (ProFAR) isomerase
MIFSALANNGTRKIKENLDNSNELQEFMNKMEKRGFLNVVITATKQDGTSKTLTYNFNRQEWEK